jgi:hypothetical protein
MGISWDDRISNIELLHRLRASMSGIEALIMNAQLRWVGHLVRMNTTLLPKIVFFSELAYGAKNIGRPLKRFKATLGACGIPLQGWETSASSCSTWRQSIHKGVKAFEVRRLQDLDQKRQARKDRRPDPSAAAACPDCGRICGSNFGLRSHKRSH